MSLRTSIYRTVLFCAVTQVVIGAAQEPPATQHSSYFVDVTPDAKNDPLAIEKATWSFFEYITTTEQTNGADRTAASLGRWLKVNESSVRSYLSGIKVAMADFDRLNQLLIDGQCRDRRTLEAPAALARSMESRQASLETRQVQLVKGWLATLPNQDREKIEAYVRDMILPNFKTYRPDFSRLMQETGESPRVILNRVCEGASSTVR